MFKETDTNQGLSAQAAAASLKSVGLNKISEEKHQGFKKILKSLFSPISIMFLTAAAFSYWGGKLFDFYFILSLMFLNFFISFWQEKKADNAIKELNKLLKFSVKVRRDGVWTQLDSEMIVPGDVLEVYIGDMIPADLEIIESQNLAVNEAALTGESLPAEKKDGELVYSGSFVVAGQALAQVKATGTNTYFGKIFSGLDKKAKRSLLEKDILTISKFLSLLSIGAVIILTAVFLWSRQPALDVLTLDLSLLIAGIPIALPTVLTLIISLGVLKLSREHVVVRRLASLEDLANVDWLFTDKTGTLTKNEITVNQVIAYGVQSQEVLAYAFLAAINNDHDVINQAIVNKVRLENLGASDYEIKSFIPADSKRKRNSALAVYQGQEVYISVGAPQIIEGLCQLTAAAKKKLADDVNQAAADGFRVLAVAVNSSSPVEANMRLVGLLLLSDELRQSAKATLKFLRENGVKVKMLTGDHRAIAYRIGADLGLGKDDIYSEILPDDKYNLVLEGKKTHTVAVTGDGVNDLPAVKAADVGFAVSNAVAALKGAADIVLLSSGISVITTAIVEARKIFARIYSYSIYRISESLRLILTILILGLVYHAYPLTPIQLILLAILNDIPIVSLAFNRVKVAHKPAQLKIRERFITSGVYGLIGVINSMLFLFIMLEYFHYGWDIISTAFFLKLTIGGHMLIFVAHTKERWYKFLPSSQVIIALVSTQILATALTALGIFMFKIPLYLIALIWIWVFAWMQVTDYFKILLPGGKKPAASV